MRKYVILDASEIDGIDFNEVVEKSANDLRYSLDQSKAITKYEGTQPFNLLGKTEYTWSEIMTVLQGAEWLAAEEGTV
jgi:hypothetical protein